MPDPASTTDHTGWSARLAGRLHTSTESLRRLVELFVLTGFTLAQPLLDVTGRAPEFFVFLRAGPLEIVAFALIVTLLPALLLWAVEQLGGLVADVVRRLLHLGFASLLLTALSIQIAKKVFADRGYSLLLAGLVVGAAATAVLVRSATLRLFLRYLTPAPVLFAMLFLVASPVGGLVRGSASPKPTLPQAQAATVGKTPPIVILFFDQFPTQFLVNADGVVDERAFPNFARLQQDSTWYRQATTNNGWTKHAVPSMLNGRYSQRRTAPSYHEYRDSLFTLVSGQYKIQASESVTQMCPPTICARVGIRQESGLLPLLRETAAVTKTILTPLKTDFDPEDQFAEQPGDIDPADLKFSKLGRGVNQPSRFTDFVTSLQASDRPALHFLHILLPHTPFKYLPSGATYKSLGREFYDESPQPGSPPTGAELAYRQRMLLQVAYLDGLMGQVIAKLEQQGMYDEALIVVTADHGIGFNHGTTHPLDRTLDATRSNAPEIAYVPTFIKGPKQRKGRIDDRNWEHVDLLPTMADMLDVEVPWKVDGFSALGPDRRTGDEKRWFNSPGKPISFSWRQSAAGMMAGMVSRWARPEHRAEGLYEYGPHRDLVNRQVGELTAGPVAAGSAVTNHGPTVRLGANPSNQPALIYGRLEGAPAGTPIAVAVNGKIGAVPLAFAAKDGSAVQFTGMVSDRGYRKGTNAVQLFVVERTGSSVVLRALPHTKQ